MYLHRLSTRAILPLSECGESTGPRPGGLVIPAIFLVLSLVTACADGGVTPTPPPTGHGTGLSTGAEEHDEKVLRYERYPWRTVEDSAVLMDFCSALIESGRELPPSILDPSLPSHIRTFAQAYYSLLSGDLAQARAGFGRLDVTSRHAAWGHIGFLEYLLLTDNIRAMEGSLSYLKGLEANGDHAIAWAYPRYAVQYAFEMGAFGDVGSLLERYRKNLDPSLYYDLKIRLLVRTNRLSEARAELESIARKIRDGDPHLILTESELVRLTKGPNHYRDYLIATLKQYPRMWQVQQHYAHHLINSGDVERGLGLLREIASTRPYDGRTQLDLLDTTLRRKLDEDVVRNIQTNKNRFQGAEYRVLLAEINYRLGRMEKAEKHWRTAEAMSPMNRSLLSFLFNMAKEQQQYAKALTVLERYLELEPNDVDLLDDKVELSFLTNNWKDTLETASAILASPRFVTSDIKDRANFYSVGSLIKLGRLQEARTKFSKITSTEMRRRAERMLNDRE